MRKLTFLYNQRKDEFNYNENTLLSEFFRKLVCCSDVWKILPCKNVRKSRQNETKIAAAAAERCGTSLGRQQSRRRAFWKEGRSII